MATRAFIAIPIKDGYKIVYVHWDGYPENIIPLLQNYNPSQLDLLISMGAISSLGKDINSTTFYHRDRGEELTIKYTSLINFEEVNYTYIYDPKTHSFTTYNSTGQIIPMSETESQEINSTLNELLNMNFTSINEFVTTLKQVINHLENPKFFDSFNHNSIESLIGKSFREGIFAASFNNEYYFVTSHQKTLFKDIIPDHLFQLPTEKMMTVMYLNKTIFNSNCKEDEKWLDDDYWIENGMTYNMKNKSQGWTSNNPFTAITPEKHLYRGVNVIKE